MNRLLTTRRWFLATLTGWPYLGGVLSANRANGAVAAPVAQGRDVIQELGVRSFINTAGTFTALTGSLMPPEVTAAMQLASRKFVRLDDLLDKVGHSRYALVIVAAKRARQINNYHHQLGEGIGFEEAPPPLVESRSKNYLTMAMEEIASGKIAFHYPQS